VDDPDGFIERAVAAGADGSVDEIRDHEMPWGVHRQGGFLDPFGHLWLVGDRSPLGAPYPPAGRRRTSSTNPPAGRPLAGHQVGGRVEVGGVPGLPPEPLPVPPPPGGAGDVLPELAWSWSHEPRLFVRCGLRCSR